MKWFKSHKKQMESPLSSYGVRYLEHNIPDRLPARWIHPARVTLENRGEMTWRAHPDDGRSVALVVRIGDEHVATHELPRGTVAPGEQVTVHFPFKAPAEPGKVTLYLEMVEHQVAVFTDKNVPPLAIEIDVGEPEDSPSTELFDLALKVDPWFYQPSRGVCRGTDGRTYPVFIERARGCHVWDPEGREYIDYVMGWGSTLLGYADERIKQAITEMLDTAPVAPLPHPVELEVALMLTEDFPGAEMVTFGKNGSDACTVAARLSRVHTGRNTILFCGYHGWQDFWAQHLDPGITGIPPRPDPLIHRFKFNDRDDFFRLFKQVKHDLAAVMIEPSGPWGGHEVGPEPDLDQTFIEEVAGAVKKAGALLVFDEIVTGYRYPGGSVGKAKGVTPDLTCLGKALASGMPLSAVVGNAAVFKQSLPRIFYGPTFKGEIYSFAAARAAIKAYRFDPVADHVWDYGTRLQQGVNDLCAQLGAAAGCKGPPFRMAVMFDEPDPYRFELKRTLFQQEMLKSGLITYNGVMLPSFAHDDAVLENTLEIMGSAMEVVVRAERENTLERCTEIPRVLF